MSTASTKKNNESTYVLLLDFIHEKSFEKRRRKKIKQKRNCVSPMSPHWTLRWTRILTKLSRFLLLSRNQTISKGTHKIRVFFSGIAFNRIFLFYWFLESKKKKRIEIVCVALGNFTLCSSDIRTFLVLTREYLTHTHTHSYREKPFRNRYRLNWQWIRWIM